jgi:hypothetical protein
MTEDQLMALEFWIVSIIRDEDRASDLHETMARSRALDDVRERFGLKVQDGD